MTPQDTAAYAQGVTPADTIPITDCVADTKNLQAVATTTDGQRYRIPLYSEGETISLAAAVKERGWIKPAYWSPIGP